MSRLVPAQAHLFRSNGSAHEDLGRAVGAEVVGGPQPLATMVQPEESVVSGVADLLLAQP